MGRAPCCDKANVKKGPWSPEEDAKLKDFMEKYGTGGNWIALPHKAGLKRCGKSCRLRWLNYLRPNIKHGEFTEEEDRIICSLYTSIGSRWSIIASHLPGRTDNDIKNYWNTKLKKKLFGLSPSPSPSHNNKKPINHLQQIHQNHSLQIQNQQLLFPSPLLTPFSNQALSGSHEQFSSPFLSPTVSSPLFQAPFSNQERENMSSMIVFGSTEKSCTGLDGYFINGGTMEDQGQKLLPNSCQGEVNGISWSDHAAPLEYNYEEIKRLILNTNSWCANESSNATAGVIMNSSSYSLEDPVLEGLKSQGKVMYQF